MQFKYKNVVITNYDIKNDIVSGVVDGKKFTTQILTDTFGQHIIVNNCKYYLNWFK